jgi:hypothetical protein
LAGVGDSWLLPARHSRAWCAIERRRRDASENQQPGRSAGRTKHRSQSSSPASAAKENGGPKPAVSNLVLDFA